MPVDRTRRELTAMHTAIVLKHDETHRWRLDLHRAGVFLREASEGPGKGRVPTTPTGLA